jgi:L-amino acid N-acyltransferase YncA
VSLRIRPAEPGDSEAIAEIHTQGVAERIATFRAEPRSVEDVRAQMGSGRPLLVAERDGKVLGWAGVGPYDDSSPWYAGVGEATVYVAREARGAGAGRALLEALERAAVAAGGYKLIAKIFDTNEPSLRLFETCGYERVGVHRRHGRLDGAWKDVVVLEKLLGEAAEGSQMDPAG